MIRARRTRLAAAAATVSLLAGSSLAGTSSAIADTGAHAKHIFVIELENKGFNETWGTGSAAPYLSQTLRAQGDLLENYYGIGHNSLVNYVAQISGQGPNAAAQTDCPLYTPFAGPIDIPVLGPSIAWGADGQLLGQGCVYPTAVQTVADQLSQAGLTWKSYDEGMTSPCQHPALWAADPNQTATATDEYATRHNPFVYFQSITGSPNCAADDVPLTNLSADLAHESSTANLSFISPDLCDDGHDAPCADGRPGGLASIDTWLRTWVPIIMNSAAYRDNGMLVITFDESDGSFSDDSACCGEGATPNTLLPGILGLGGGKVGALVLSPRATANSTDSNDYNHYSLLRTIEDNFALSPLGYAATATDFAPDVLNHG